MRKPKLKLFRLEGWSIGVGYYTKEFHIAILCWLLTIEFKK